MKITLLSLFPSYFQCLRLSIPGRAIASGALELERLDPRDFARDRHRTVDDTPYGGGPGMVMRADVLAEAVRFARESNPGAPAVYLTPQGAPFAQRHAEHFASLPGLILVCGRYEGVDERFIRSCVDFEVSVGDFVLSGGEPAAVCVVDSVSRLLPGVLGNDDSAELESFGSGLLEHPQFTRPRTFESVDVPDVLLSGDHGRIGRWREEVSRLRTAARRPDLLEDVGAPAVELEFEVPDWLVDPRHLQVAVDDE